MDVSEDEEMKDEHEIGHRTPKKVQDPRLPTQAEIDEHNFTHLPYRSLCTHCVLGREESHPHRRAVQEERQNPAIHMGYCLMGEKDEDTQPIMVIKDRDAGKVCIS